MKTLCNTVVFALGIVLSAHGVETATVPTLPAPGLIDGELTEQSWGKALKTGGFVPLDPAGAVTEATEGFLFCDAENLYVGARMHFGDYAAHEKWATSTEKKFKGDSVEVFLDPGDTGSYAQIIVAENGGVIFSQGLCAPLSVAVQLHEKDWTMEAKIPYAALRLQGSSFGKSWRINLARNNREKNELSTWSRLSGGGFHDIAAFNRVEGIPADLAAIRREQAFAAKGDFEIETDHIVYTTQTVARVALDFLYDKPMNGFKAVATLKDERGGTVATQSVSRVAFHVDFELPVGGLADGRYDVAVSLLDAAGNPVKSGEAQVWKIPPMPPNPDRCEVKNHCIYHNGEFTFPVISTSFPLWTTFTNRADWVRESDRFFGDIADSGFTAIMTWPRTFAEEDAETYKKCGLPRAWETKEFAALKAAGITFADYCASAARHGLSVIVHSPYFDRKGFSPLTTGCFIDHVRRIRTTPNIMCWEVSDEWDGRPEANRAIRRLYNEIDPTRFTWINVINAVMPNIDAADVISTDPYPVPVTRLAMVASHGDRLVRATEGRPGQGRWLWLQMFGNEGNWTRPPTPDEIKCMTMLAVNHGVTGLAYFQYTRPEKRGKRQHPGSMEAVKEMSAVLRQYAPALCQGKVVFRGRIGGADVLAVEHEGRKVLSVVNDTDGDLEGLVVEVPGFGKTTVNLKKYGYTVVEL